MQRAPIFKGCTRPAMKMGVPLVPLLLVAGGSALSAVWLGYLVSWVAAVSILIIGFVLIITMRGITKKDDQRLKQVMMRVVIRLAQLNYQRWGAISFSPIRYKRRKP
jgi:type IV secretion system protein VirB3